jgi:transposase-like protein
MSWERMMRKIKRRGEQAWRELVARQARSGLSVAEFCQREGISAWSLYEWRKRLRPNDGDQGPVGTERSAREGAAGFIDLGAIASGGSRCEIRLDLGGGVVLHLVRS